MRHRVTIQQPTEVQDEYGQPIVTWNNWIASEPAEFKPTGGTESMRGEQLEANVKGIFRVRYRSGYTTQMKVIYNGTSYGILYVNPVDGGRRYIDLMVAASGAL
jgi:SPP1 family predicted phage head-tail adaptor